ncbi:MAG: hypothetical protein H7834_11895 [Magnetococcus sp. YQC-9]
MPLARSSKEAFFASFAKNAPRAALVFSWSRFAPLQNGSKKKPSPEQAAAGGNVRAHRRIIGVNPYSNAASKFARVVAKRRQRLGHRCRALTRFFAKTAKNRLS